MKEVSLYVLGAAYVIAGVMHFVRPKWYLRMMPPYIPFHHAAVYVSGVAEIALGVGVLIPQVSTWAAWGLVALLIAVFPANLYMFTNHERFKAVPRWLLAARLPFQLVLIAWAWWHTG